jgi:hypothetical protein
MFCPFCPFSGSLTPEHVPDLDKIEDLTDRYFNKKSPT